MIQAHVRTTSLAMPFTPAHPAAAAPLARLLGPYGVLSALVIGSMVPDAIYFVPWADLQGLDLGSLLPAGPRREYTHSLLGLVTFCLPAGIVAYVVYHLLLKHPLLELMPAGITAKLAPVVGEPWRLPALGLCPGWTDASQSTEPAAPHRRRLLESARVVCGAVVALGCVCCSLLLGALTHTILDSCTHARTPVTDRWPFFKQRLLTIWGQPIHVYSLLQVALSAIGMALLAWWAWRWLRTAQPAPYRRVFSRPLRVGLLSAALIVAALAAAWRVGGMVPQPLNGPSLVRVVARGSLAAVGALIVSLAVLGIAWHVCNALGVREPGEEEVSGRRGDAVGDRVTTGGDEGETSFCGDNTVGDDVKIGARP